MINRTKYKICNVWICRIEDSKILPQFGDLEIDNGRITDLTERRYPELRTDIDEKNHIDAAGRVATVPMINFHDHIYSRLARGLPASGPMDRFVDILENLWWRLDSRLDPDMVRVCTKLAVEESVRNGVTCIFDHHASPNAVAGILDIIAETLEEFQIRGVLCLETSDRHGGTQAGAELEENRRFIRDSTGKGIQGMLGLHAPFTLSDDTLVRAGKLVKILSTGIHTHVAEDRYEMTFSRENFGVSPVQRLVMHGLLNEKSIIAHGVYLEKEDFDLIAGSDSALVLNPDSNLNNAVGMPVFSKIPVGIPVLPGTDGMHSNMARTLKQLFLMHRMQGGSFDASFDWIKKLCFDQLKVVRRWFPDFPALGTGDRADLILWDYRPPTPFTQENFWGHFIYGMLERQMHSVIQNGKVLMNNFLLDPDLEVGPAEIFRQGKRLFEKMRSPTPFDPLIIRKGKEGAGQ